MIRKITAWVVCGVMGVSLFAICGFFPLQNENDDLRKAVNDFLCNMYCYAFDADIIENGAAVNVLSDGEGNLFCSADAEKYLDFLLGFSIAADAERLESAGGLVVEYRSGDTVFYVSRTGLKRIDAQFSDSLVIVVFNKIGGEIELPPPVPEPEEPKVPDEPEIPVPPEPEEPDEPVIPQDPENPENPEEPEIPDPPKEPNEPYAPDPPQEPDEPPPPDTPDPDSRGAELLTELADLLSVGADVLVSTKDFSARLVLRGNDYYFEDMRTGYAELFVSGQKFIFGSTAQNYPTAALVKFYLNSYISMFGAAAEGGDIETRYSGEATVSGVTVQNEGFTIEIYCADDGTAEKIEVFESGILCAEIIVYAAGDSVVIM